MIRNTLLLIFAFSATLNVSAQTTEAWTLEKCIEHAREKNLNLKINQNKYKKAVYDHRQSGWDMGPKVSGFADGNVDFQRSANQNYQIQTGTSYNMSYGIGASLNLFAGFTAHNTMAAKRFYKMAVGEDTKQSEYLLEMDITEMYSKVLYQKSLVDIAREQLTISMHESERIAATIETGQLENVAQFEIDATVSNNRLELSRAENEYRLLKLRLAQAIEYPDVEQFEIADAGFEAAAPGDNKPDVDSLYLVTSLIYPAVQQRELEMEYYRKLLQVTKGNYAPTLSLKGGYTSGYYSTDTLASGKKSSFSTQFDKYGNPYLGMSLNIPIFTGRRRDFQTKKSRIDVENALFALDNQKKLLRRELEEAVFQLEAFYLEYTAASQNLEFVEKSFETYREKYRLGLINTTDFMTAQNQYAQAQANVMRAQYSWVVQKRTLDIYCRGI